MADTPNAPAQPLTAMPGPSTTSVVLWLGLAAIGVAGLIGLLVVAGPGGQKDVLGWLNGIVTLLAAGGATGAAVQARRALGVSHRNAETTQRVEAQTAQIQKQTNGALDARIQSGMVEAIKIARREWEEEAKGDKS